MALQTSSAEAYMRRAIELAQRGLGLVEPNPLVGAVIVSQAGQIVGEGWHQKFGGPHAEVHALAEAGESARGATLYVTLEPCCHFGKTPPCSRAVIAAGIRRVVVATVDPAAHVNGGGIAELKGEGIEVEVGMLGDDARALIAPFTKLMTTGIPWIIAKWAMTLDGRIATRTGSSRWISNEASRRVAHQLRARVDAIVVGAGTVIADDPLLTARPAGPRTATRVVLDSTCRTPLESQLALTARNIPTIIATTSRAPVSRCDALREVGVEILTLSSEATGRPDFGELVKELGKRRYTNILIEGGSSVLGSCFDGGWLDEAHAFIAPKFVGGAAASGPIGGRGLDEMAGAWLLARPIIETLDGDIYVHGMLKTPG